METYSYVDDQDSSTEIETVSERLFFLTLEWTLILGWIASMLLVWRVTFVALVERFLPLQSIRLGIIIAAWIVMLGSVYALTMTGRWLRKRPVNVSLVRRWATNAVLLISVTALGRLIVWYFI